MPNRPAEIIVRCEDLQQRVFIYRCLVKNGIHPRTIQIRHNPGGDAKRFVLDRYPVEVKALRRTPHASKAVISMMDADDCTVEERKRQHNNALNKSGQDHRANVENVGECLAQAAARLTDPMLYPPSPNLAGQRAGLVSVRPLQSVTTRRSVGVTWKPWRPGLPIR